MTTTRKRPKVSFTDEELAIVKEKATQLRLTVSELLRRLALGYRIPDPGEFAAAAAIGDLLKINADQARLGNLLKLALEVGDEDLPPATITRIDALVADIRQVQETIRERVKALDVEMRPRKPRK